MMHREVQTSASKSTCLHFHSEQSSSNVQYVTIATTPPPAPAQPGPARHTAQVGAVQAYLVHRSSGSSGVLMTGLLFVCVQNVSKTAYGCVP